MEIEPRNGLEKKGAGDPGHEAVATQQKLANFAPRRLEGFENPCKKHIKFWLKDPLALFEEFYLIPRSTMTLNQKLNSVVRTSILFAGITHLLLNFARSVYYVVILAMIGTIIVYFSPGMQCVVHDRKDLAVEKTQELIVSAIAASPMADQPVLSKEDIVTIAAAAEKSPEAVAAVLDKVTTLIPNTSESQISDDAIFKIPQNYEWTKDTTGSADPSLFRGLNQAWETETHDQREVLLTYGDMLNEEFEHELTKDIYGKESQWWRDQGSFLVDRDVYHPKNTDLFFDPY